jgi:conjugative relaxase-like TrwC/TraI family protein
MLTVAKVTQAAAAGYADYLEGKSQAGEQGDYYLKDGERVEAPGRWTAGADAVGCDPSVAVRADELRALMAVRRPDTRQRLRPAGGTGEAVAALDATFSAPKSVSAAWAIVDRGLRNEIEEAHERAIDRAVQYSVERVAMIRQRLDPATVMHAKPAGLIATSWRHTTARVVDGSPPDPQLHSHVLLHGAIRRDGRIVAIDSRSWLVHRREVGAAYRTELGHELHRLGFQIRRATGRGGRYFEIDGIPAGLIDRWSSRHHQVQAAIRDRLADQRAALMLIASGGGPDSALAAKRLELLTRNGQLAPAHERLMSTATRSAKAPVTVGDLDARWRATAAEHHLDPERLRASRPVLEPASRGVLLDGLTEFDATFPARDARAVALEQSAGVPIAQALEPLRELRAANDILVLADRTGTTRDHRGRETTTIAIARRLTAATVPPLAASIVAAQAERLDQELAQRGGRLSREQREAIELACGTRALVVIEGQAGTGKSTTLIGIARAHQACGRELIVTSTAALAAERLARELHSAGIGTSAYSTAALGSAIATGQLELDPQTTIIHDEAALASTREQHQLLTQVQASGARLIEVGDPQQNQPVGAGGLWHRLETTTRHAGSHVELTHNQRTQDPADRCDQARFRHGYAERAIRGYGARDRLHIHPDQSRAEDHALDAAHADHRSGKSTIVIAQTSNEHLDELNARAQAVRQQHGELGAPHIPAPGRPYELHPGDLVQVRHTIPHESLGRLRNGTTAEIADVDSDSQRLDLQLVDGQRITLEADQAERGDLRLAYVQHPFPAQGLTTDTSHLIVAEHATHAGTYVALTRARHQTHIHAADPTTGQEDTDRVQALAEHLSRTEPDLPSIDTPLEQERVVTDQPDGANHAPQHTTNAQRIEEAGEVSVSASRIADGPPRRAARGRHLHATNIETTPEHNHNSEQLETEQPTLAEHVPSDPTLDIPRPREWARMPRPDLGTHEVHLDRDTAEHHTWEL